MIKVPRIPRREVPDDILYCERCGKAVEEFTPEQPDSHPGEAIVTVRCHGETWRMSNLRGRLD